MHESKFVSTIVAVLGAFVIVALSAMIFEGCQRSAQRKQEVVLACVDKADNSAEAVICRNRVEPA